MTKTSYMVCIDVSSLNLAHCAMLMDYLIIENVLGTCKCHADMLVQGTDLTDSPFFLQLCNRFLLDTKDNDVFTSDSHLYRKNDQLSTDWLYSCKSTMLNLFCRVSSSEHAIQKRSYFLICV